MAALAFFVIVLVNFLESEDKGFHCHSPCSGPEEPVEGQACALMNGKKLSESH